MPTFQLASTVLGAPDPQVLADFYRELLGWEQKYAEPGWVMLASPNGYGLSFQSEEHHVRPVWPGEPGEQQQQLHLDIRVDDLAAASARAEQLGAVLAEFQPQEGVRVHLDPAGHPFCLFEQ
ncbi:MAG TPA: VOC family protein [Amnibacterium sp.]|jgi:catechol 2,3-dioxygenase-like lactoylglutathione lyase family enzyme|uniref:VOC family protein n=1 Tax=Amnibacterium sp. TaxID=1872496 RepID=UPI002F92B351